MIHSIQAYVDVSEGRLYVEQAGSGNPIVFIHGFGADSRVWDCQFEAFARRNHVIRIDLRGHGMSDVPDGKAYSYAEDLNRLLEQLHIPQACIIGQSLGGGIALEFALAYPQKTSSLVLVDSTLDGYTWSTEWTESWTPIYREFAIAGANAALPKLLAHPLFAPGFRQSALKARLSDILAGYSGWHILNEDPVIESDPPAIQLLEKIQAPTLILVGELDLPDFHAISDILEKKIPNAQKVELDDVGHVLPMEAPEACNRIILNFLESLNGKG